MIAQQLVYLPAAFGSLITYPLVHLPKGWLALTVCAPGLPEILGSGLCASSFGRGFTASYGIAYDGI